MYMYPHVVLAVSTSTDLPTLPTYLSLSLERDPCHMMPPGLEQLAGCPAGHRWCRLCRSARRLVSPTVTLQLESTTVRNGKGCKVGCGETLVAEDKDAQNPGDPPNQPVDVERA